MKLTIVVVCAEPSEWGGGGKISIPKFYYCLVFDINTSHLLLSIDTNRSMVKNR